MAGMDSLECGPIGGSAARPKLSSFLLAVAKAQKHEKILLVLLVRLHEQH